jgi:hypothetical protein
MRYCFVVTFHHSNPFRLSPRCARATRARLYRERAGEGYCTTLRGGATGSGVGVVQKTRPNRGATKPATGCNNFGFACNNSVFFGGSCCRGAITRFIGRSARKLPVVAIATGIGVATCNNWQQLCNKGRHYLPSLSTYSPRFAFSSQPSSIAFFAMRLTS